jgi:hypothetical protein
VGEQQQEGQEQLPGEERQQQLDLELHAGQAVLLQVGKETQQQQQQEAMLFPLCYPALSRDLSHLL